MTGESSTVFDALTPEEIAGRIAAEFPDTVKVTKTAIRRVYLTAERSSIFRLCAFMKDSLGFDHASCVSGLDRCDRYQVVYHLMSYQSNVTAEIVVNLPHDKPEVDSVTPLWGGANWHEREAYDMYGIIFIGHPRLERILLPDDYQYFPMRKKCEGGKD